MQKPIASHASTAERQPLRAIARLGPGQVGPPPVQSLPAVDTVKGKRTSGLHAGLAATRQMADVDTVFFKLPSVGAPDLETKVLRQHWPIGRPRHLPQAARIAGRPMGTGISGGTSVS